jgi:hypothetical protein
MGSRRRDCSGSGSRAVGGRSAIAATLPLRLHHGAAHSSRARAAAHARWPAPAGWGGGRPRLSRSA